MYVFLEPLVEIFQSSVVCPIKDIGGTRARIYRIERRVVQAKTPPVDSRTTFRVIAALTAIKMDDKKKDSKSACSHPGGCSIAHDSDCGAVTSGTSGVGSSRRDDSPNDGGRPRCDYVLAGYSFADDLNLSLGPSNDQSDGPDENGSGNAERDGDARDVNAPNMDFSDDVGVVGADNGNDASDNYAPGDSCSTH